jgi:hypothetical protein
MKLTKKHYTIIGVVIALIAIWYFFLRKKEPAESGYNPDILVPGNEMWGNESGYTKRRFGIFNDKIYPRCHGSNTPGALTVANQPCVAMYQSDPVITENF